LRDLSFPPTTGPRPRSRSATASGSTWRSLLADPHVLLLDEPTAALDPRQRRRLWETARGVRDAAGAVVLVTQNIEDLEHVADRVVALLDGRVVFDGPVTDYLSSEAAGALVG
jgi:ABC-type multidrug transport system ATPase subunit